MIGSGGHAEAKRGDGDASAVEDAHGIDEALALDAEEVFGGNLAVFKDQLGGV